MFATKSVKLAPKPEQLMATWPRYGAVPNTVGAGCVFCFCRVMVRTGAPGAGMLVPTAVEEPRPSWIVNPNGKAAVSSDPSTHAAPAVKARVNAPLPLALGLRVPEVK